MTATESTVIDLTAPVCTHTFVHPSGEILRVWYTPQYGWRTVTRLMPADLDTLNTPCSWDWVIGVSSDKSVFAGEKSCNRRVRNEAEELAEIGRACLRGFVLLGGAPYSGQMPDNAEPYSPYHSPY